VTLAKAISAFLLSCEAAGHTMPTRRTYSYQLSRFQQACGQHDVEAVTPQVIQDYLSGLRARMKPVSAHQPFRVLRTFFRWASRSDLLDRHPMDGMTMRIPKMLPLVPDDDAVRRLLAACPNTYEGRRNRALVALAADSGLRRDELRRLRIGSADLATRVVRIHEGKGQKDGVTFFGQASASLLRAWLLVHPDRRPESFLFVTRDGEQLGPSAITRILHRLSRRAELDRPLGPHALRHYAATAILRRTGDLELVRRVLRHETLTMALRYATLATEEIAAKYERAAPLDHLVAASHRVPTMRLPGLRS
jgi:integrase/recombinase XerC